MYLWTAFDYEWADGGFKDNSGGYGEEFGQKYVLSDEGFGGEWYIWNWNND